MMSKIVIIGSGIGGLTAGNLLAKKGHKVTIFESHRTPGGYTAGFKRKGFYFESGTLSFESSKMILKAMKDIGVLDKIDFVRQETRFISEDFDCNTESYEKFKDVVYSSFLSERASLERYFFEVDKMYRAMLPFIMDEKNIVKKGLSYLVSGIKMMRIFKKYFKMNINQFTEKYFNKGTKLYRIFKSFGYPEMYASILGGAITTLFDDYWTVKSGMQHWADVLADNFKSLGGELLLNSSVDKILTRDGAAVGVKVNEKTYDADYVISACDYKKTFLALLDNRSIVPDEMLDKIKVTSVSEGFFTVYLGLTLSNDKLKEFMKIPHVISLDEKEGADVHNPYDESYFKKVSCILYSPSLMNRAHAPKGKSSLMLQVMSPNNWMDNWGGGDSKEYKKLKEEVKNTLIEKASSIIPDLKKYIEFEDAATPLTYERYTHNTNGATSAWSWNPKNQFYKNFMGSTVKTPVKNLLIGSCWATQIGGVPSAIGAAYRCMKQIK